MTEQHFTGALSGKPPENYERFFVPAIGEPLAKDLVTVASLRKGERLLDVASGTGIVARLAAPKVGAAGDVKALDPNPGMLDIARSSTPQGVSIEWCEADAADMPFPDQSVDVVTCQMGIQFMPDKPAALREMRRVLAPDGRLVLNVPGPKPRMFAIMAEGLAHHVAPEAAGFVDLVFSLHEEAVIQDLLNDAGFDDVSIHSETKHLRLPSPAEFLWQYVHSTPIAAKAAELDGKRRGALEGEVVAKWQEFKEDGFMNLEVRVLTAVARK